MNNIKAKEDYVYSSGVDYAVGKGLLKIETYRLKFNGDYGHAEHPRASVRLQTRD